MQDNRLGVSLPERLVEKSHFLSRLFERPLILNPVLQRNTRKINHWCHSTQNSGRHFFSAFFWLKKEEQKDIKRRAYNGKEGKLLQEVLRVVSTEISKVSCRQKVNRGVCGPDEESALPHFSSSLFQTNNCLHFWLQNGSQLQAATTMWSIPGIRAA